MQDYLIIESTISQDIVFLSRKNYIVGVMLKKNHNKQISIDKGAVWALHRVNQRRQFMLKFSVVPFCFV
jgi:hypothetical protein